MSQDDKLNYGLDTTTVDTVDSVIIDAATKPLIQFLVFILKSTLYDEIVDGITNAFGQKKFTRH